MLKEQVLQERYLMDGETEQDMYWRVANYLADNDKESNRFYEVMSKGYFLPNSPTLMNAGKPNAQLSACFVLPIDDSMDSIFTAVKNMALIHKSGGGTGFSFSKLRPMNDSVKSTNGVASGPISFMKVFDVATSVVKQGGTRRGANIAVLRIDHPDIVDFITCKANVTEFTNFNISVGITDKFMEALFADTEYDLIHPNTNEVVKRVSAKEVWDLICSTAHQFAEPGLLFLDHINHFNPTPELGEIETTNPCLSGNTWVTTENGPKQIFELEGIPSQLLLDGKFNKTSEDGFFITGYKPVFKISTDKGYSVEATADHLIKTIGGWTRVEDLNIGDSIELSSNRGSSWEGYGKLEDGYLLGMLVGDGTLKDEGAILSVWDTPSLVKAIEQTFKSLGYDKHFQKMIEDRKEFRLKSCYVRDLAYRFDMSVGEKRITPAVEKTCSDFHIGFIRGMFDSDGTVIGSTEKGISVRLWQHDLENLYAIQRMLHRLGILSTIYTNRKPEGKKLLPDGKGGYKEYDVKAGHELVISNDNLQFFYDIIGFNHEDKQNKLRELLETYKRTPNKTVFIATITGIEYIGDMDVYDVNVPNINAFEANGIVVHNCGEQPLLPYESCVLGSINLGQMVKDGKINYNKLKYTTMVAVHLLNRVVDKNIYPLDEINQMSRQTRKIGLGVMGFADMLIRLSIPYAQSVPVIKDVMGFIKQVAYDIIEKYDYQNKSVFTIAPTGSISILAECSSGIEPIFALAGTRKSLDGKEFAIESSCYNDLKTLAERIGVWSEELQQHIYENGSIIDRTEFPAYIRELFKTAREISPYDHVNIQAAFQSEIDNAVSKTINLPFYYSVKEVSDIFKRAWSLGCKGITIYVDGSRPDQVLDTREKCPVCV